MRPTTPATGGMFDEYEPPAPAAGPVAEPLFDLTETPVARTPDYGVAVAPVREASPEALFDTELVIGSRGAFELGLVALPSPADHYLPVVDTTPDDLAAALDLPLVD